MNFKCINNPFPNEESLTSTECYLILQLIRYSLSKDLGKLKFGSSEYNISSLYLKTKLTRKTVKKTLISLELKGIINIKDDRINIIDYDKYVYSGKVEIENKDINKNNFTSTVDDEGIDVSEMDFKAIAYVRARKEKEENEKKELANAK